MDVSDSEERRKAAAGELIRKYYYQLTVGCGKKNCDNPNCASSGPSSLSPNDAAAQAILCVKVGTAVLVLSSQSHLSGLFRKKTSSVRSHPKAKLTLGPGRGRLRRRKKRRRWRFVPKEVEEVVVEVSPLLAVPWLPVPVVSMCRHRPSVPVKLKVIIQSVIW